MAGRFRGVPSTARPLAAEGDRVIATWYTAPEGVLRVHVAFSDDGGQRFMEPVVVAEDTPTGRVDVVLLDDGRAAVSWLGKADDSAALRVQSVDADGTAGSPVAMAELSSASRGVGMPRLVRSGDALYAAWTSPEGGVQMGRLSAEKLR
jgi:hypothetical protein